MSEFIIEVGKSYMNGYGQRRIIDRVDGEGRYFSREGGPFTWRVDGRVSEEGVTTLLDLTAEYEPNENDECAELIPGMIYLCAGGSMVTIMRNPEMDCSGSEYVFKGSNGLYYTSTGRIYAHSNGAIETPLDIVKWADRTVIVNEESYARFGEWSPHKSFTLTVEAILDMVPGPWNKPDDLMRWIASHGYVRRVILDETDRSECIVKFEDLNFDV